MKEISLTNGMVAIVDDEDFERLSQLKWFAHKRAHTYYAYRNIYITSGVKLKIRMHRDIVGATNPIIEVDHINGNGLDNRRINLRLVTKSQNQMNKRIQSNNKSGYKGVCWHKLREKWMAYIKINQKRIFIGYYIDKKEAAMAYNIAAKKYFGEYALFNK